MIAPDLSWKTELDLPLANIELDLSLLMLGAETLLPLGDCPPLGDDGPAIGDPIGDPSPATDSPVTERVGTLGDAGACCADDPLGVSSNDDREGLDI